MRTLARTHGVQQPLLACLVSGCSNKPRAVLLRLFLLKRDSTVRSSDHGSRGQRAGGENKKTGTKRRSNKSNKPGTGCVWLKLGNQRTRRGESSRKTSRNGTRSQEAEGRGQGGERALPACVYDDLAPYLPRFPGSVCRGCAVCARHACLACWRWERLLCTPSRRSCLVSLPARHSVAAMLAAGAEACDGGVWCGGVCPRVMSRGKKHMGMPARARGKPARSGLRTEPANMRCMACDGWGAPFHGWRLTALRHAGREDGR